MNCFDEVGWLEALETSNAHAKPLLAYFQTYLNVLEYNKYSFRAERSAYVDTNCIIGEWFDSATNHKSDFRIVENYGCYIEHSRYGDEKYTSLFSLVSPAPSGPLVVLLFDQRMGYAMPHVVETREAAEKWVKAQFKIGCVRDKIGDFCEKMIEGWE